MVTEAENHVQSSKTVAVWQSTQQRALVIKHCGKLLRHMGYANGADHCLMAEEVLYLAERDQILVLPSSSVGEPVSLPSLYALVIQDCTATSTDMHRTANVFKGETVSAVMCVSPLTLYWVYAHLKNLGYVVFRTSVTPRYQGRFMKPQFGSFCDAPPTFEVYEPSHAVLSRPGTKPSFYVVVTTYVSRIPTIPMLVELAEQCNGVRLKAAVVSGDGTVLMFDLGVGMITTA